MPEIQNRKLLFRYKSILFTGTSQTLSVVLRMVDKTQI